MTRIDGAFGEGGGQILRTSLSLSLATGKAFRIDHIRARRERSGLLRQHLTAVRAAAEVSGGHCEGAELGSSQLTFTPGPVRAGEYRFSVGTAGSATLVLQTILPALMVAATPSLVTVEGGTHNPAAPPFPFLEKAYLPLLHRMGPDVQVSLERYGFYPAGGGRIVSEIRPCGQLRPLHLAPRGEILSRCAVAIVANLPGHIAVRELETVGQMMDCPPECRVIRDTKNSTGPGNAVMVELTSAQVTEVFTAYGRIGLSAEKVAGQAVREAREYLVSSAVAGEHLTDQLLLPMALAGGGSFTALKWSQYALTNAQVIGEFLPVRFDLREETGHIRVEAVRT